MEICGVNVHDLGTNPFISKVEMTVNTQGNKGIFIYTKDLLEIQYCHCRMQICCGVL